MRLHELEAFRRTVNTRSGEISCIDTGIAPAGGEAPRPAGGAAARPAGAPGNSQAAGNSQASENGQAAVAAGPAGGPVALFVHGIATNAYLWRNVIGPLVAGRRCIAVDLPMHGRSPLAAGQDLSLAAMAAVLEDFCDALGLTQIDLVANDTGGAVAQIFAARHPERLATLTLTNCDTSENLPPEPFKPIVELAAAGGLAPGAVALMSDLPAARDAAFGGTYEHPGQADPEVIRAYLEPCFGTIERAREFERLLVSLDPDDLRAIEPQLRGLRVPTLLVWGTGDENFPVSWAYWLRDRIPGVTEVVEVDGAALFFPEERPADLVPHLERHWAAHPAGAGRAPVAAARQG